MSVVRSPLGALGALMVLINLIAGGTLVPLKEQPDLQRLIVYGLLIYMILIIAIVWWLLWYIVAKLKRPELLFDATSLHPAAQIALIVGSKRHDVPPPELTPFRVDPPDAVNIEVRDSDKSV